MFFFFQAYAGILVCAKLLNIFRDFGYAGTDSWRATILSLFTRGTAPVLVTEYTRLEIEKDLEKLKKLCGTIKTIVQIKTNPFCSLKPGLNIISEEETPVIFKNYFCVILKPQLGQEHEERKKCSKTGKFHLFILKETFSSLFWSQFKLLFMLVLFWLRINFVYKL